MALSRFRVTERQVLMLLFWVSVIGVGGAFLLSGFRRQEGERLERLTQPRVRWMPPTEAEAAPLPLAYVIAEYFDPSLMSLPSPRGFSARMWERTVQMPTRTYEPPSSLAWLEPVSDIEFPAMLQQQAEVTADKLPAALIESFSNDLPATPARQRQSSLSIEGALQDRAFLERPNLPTPLSETGLRRTRVRVAVAADGRVRYAVLDRSSGNDAVDTQALELTRRLRFEPVSSEDPLALTWGVLKFSWATAEKTQ